MVETMEEARAGGQLSALLENTLSSVEITHTTKGDTWKIKAYSKDVYEAKRQVEVIHADFGRKYGKTNGI